MDTHIQKLGKFALACILAISMSLPVNALGNKADAAENVAASTADNTAAAEANAAAQPDAGVEAAADAANSTEAVTLTESGNIADWTACGTCEWMIDADGNMTIRPASGASEGTLDSWTSVMSDQSPWADFKSKIKTATVQSKVYAITCDLFLGMCSNLTSVDLSGLETSSVSDMSGMFYNCSSLTSLDVSKLDTSNVQDMSQMFYGCPATTLNLANFNTDKVTNMRYMFYGCNNLLTLNLNNLVTSNVTDFYAMFQNCSSLTSLDLSGLNTSNVTKMDWMFMGCSSLTNLDLSGFDTSKASMQWMFVDCNALANVKLGEKFSFCGSGTERQSDLPGYSWKNSAGKTFWYKEIPNNTADTYTLDPNGDIVPWQTCGTCEWMIDANGNMTIRPANGASEGTLDKWEELTYNTSNQTSPTPWAAYGSKIKTAKVQNKVYASTCNAFFYNCYNLKEVDLSGLDTSKATNMGLMFSGSGYTDISSGKGYTYYAPVIETLNLSNFDTSNVTNMSYMFEGCAKLQILDLISFDTSKATKMEFMFTSCKALDTVKLGTKFSFNGASETRQCSLPDGNWVNSVGKVFAANEVPNNVADTYTKEGFSALDFTKFTVNTADAVYTGSPIVGRVSSSSYTEGTDYTVAYANNTEIGKATITITGTGSYTGSKTYEFKIAKEGTLAGEASADTAAAIAKEAFPEGVSSGWVVIARDDDFADAMSATGLAGALDAPILLTNRNELSSVTAQTVKELGATQAYIIGGTGAIPADLESALKTQANCTVKARVAGTDAWDTSVECAKRIKEHGGNKTGEAIVAMGTNFQDALSISSFAYKYALPLFLETDAQRGRCLTADAKAAVREAIGSTGTIYVPGGTGAVPEASVEGEFTGSNIVRLEGYNGYDTSNQIATWMVKNNKLDASTICVANGSEAPKGTDALAGAALAGKRGGVMLLTNSVSSFGDTSRTTIDGTDSKNTPAFIKTNATSVKSAYMLGGSAVMPDDLKQSIANILG